MGNSLPTEDFNTFIRELNAIDISNLDAWDGLEETLNSLGLNSIVTSNNFKNLSTEMQNAAGAVEKIDLTKFVETFRDLQKIVNDIYSGD
jgi:hypothetical protein